MPRFGKYSISSISAPHRIFGTMRIIGEMQQAYVPCQAHSMLISCAYKEMDSLLVYMNKGETHA
jgi:hypothetical protein